MRSQRVVLQCNRCKKLYSVKQTKWEKLLQRWGTINNAVQNYVCKKCEFFDGIPDYKEKASAEEMEALLATIDGKPFNPLAAASLVKKIGIVRKMWQYAKVFVVNEASLKKYYQKWLEENQRRNLNDNTNSIATGPAPEQSSNNRSSDLTNTSSG